MSPVRALQNAELDRFWQEFEAVMGGPEGLMTYRYLGTHAEALDRHHARGRMRLRSDLRTSFGLRAAPLLILVADVVGILDDAIAVPAPTQFDLEVLDDGAGVDEVYCIGEVFHEGRTQLFSRARCVDAADHQRVLALCWDAGVVVAPAPEGYRYVDPGPGVPDSPSLPPARRRQPGDPPVDRATGLDVGVVAPRPDPGGPRGCCDRSCRGRRADRCAAPPALARHLHGARQAGPLRDIDRSARHAGGRHRRRSRASR